MFSKIATLVLLVLVFAAPAAADTAQQALDAPYTSADLFRAPTAPSPDIWNRAIPVSQPVDPNSASYTTALRVSMGINPDGTIQPGTSGKRWRSAYFVYVNRGASVYKTACSRYVLNGTSWSWNRSFHEATVVNKVPVPTGALKYDGGSDHSMAILDIPSNTYYEFYQGLDPAPAGTKDPQGRACDYLYSGGGRMRQIKTPAGLPWYTGSPGYFRNNQPAEDMLWGRQATGAMPVIGGLVTIDEWNNPSPTTGFGHVMSVVVPFSRCGVKHWPATRNDCGPNGSLPEGSLTRFSSSADCKRWNAAINDPATTPARQLYLRRIRGFCITAQVYGFRDVDQTWNGFAWKMPAKPGILPDGGSAGGGSHWPNDYLDPLGIDFATHLEVMAENPHPTQWAPGCLC